MSATARHDWLQRISTLQESPAGPTLRLRRAWPRSTDHVLLEYTGGDTARHLRVGQWLADTHRLHGIAEATKATAGAGSVTVLPMHGVMLHRHGVDRRLTGVPPLLADPAATLVVHRPERRAVLRLDPSSGVRTERQWAKVVRPERLASLLSRSQRLGPLGSAVPRLVEVRHDRGVTVWSDLPGTSLADMLGRPSLTATMAQVGVLIRRLHDIVEPAPSEQVHTAGSERVHLDGWMSRLRAFDPATYGSTRALYMQTVALLRPGEGTGGRLVTVHRDLHDGQLIVDHPDIGLLDPDTLSVGEPELDLGNLYAHLRFAACAGRCDGTTADDAFAALLDAYGAERVDRERLHAYTAAALVRLIGVHAFRPPTRPWIDLLRDDTQRFLTEEYFL